jgi:hypothetical protein
VELENALEQEQESLVNRLWKRMDKLEAEKRFGICTCFAYAILSENTVSFVLIPYCSFIRFFMLSG